MCNSGLACFQSHSGYFCMLPFYCDVQTDVGSLVVLQFQCFDIVWFGVMKGIESVKIPL